MDKKYEIPLSDPSEAAPTMEKMCTYLIVDISYVILVAHCSGQIS